MPRGMRWPASAARRPAEHLQRGPPGAGAAHRLSELQPLALRSGRHLGHGQPAELHRLGLARALSRHAAAPVDALAAWNTTDETPRALKSAVTGVPAIANAATYNFASPNQGTAAQQERNTAEVMASNPAPGGPHLALVNGANRGAIETLDRVAQARDLHADRRLSRTTASRWRCAPWRAPSCAASARRSTGCPPAATTRTRSRARAPAAATPI